MPTTSDKPHHELKVAILYSNINGSFNKKSITSTYFNSHILCQRSLVKITFSCQSWYPPVWTNEYWWTAMTQFSQPWNHKWRTLPESDKRYLNKLLSAKTKWSSWYLQFADKYCWIVFMWNRYGSHVSSIFETFSPVSRFWTKITEHNFLRFLFCFDNPNEFEMKRKKDMKRILELTQGIPKRAAHQWIT